MHRQYPVCLLLEVLSPASPAGQVRVSLSRRILQEVVLSVVTLVTWLEIAPELGRVHLHRLISLHVLHRVLRPFFQHQLPPHLLSQLEVDVGEVEVTLEGEARPGTMPF